MDVKANHVNPAKTREREIKDGVVHFYKKRQSSVCMHDVGCKIWTVLGIILMAPSFLMYSISSEAIVKMKLSPLVILSVSAVIMVVYSFVHILLERL
jgi:hypothetical protein